jgi:hypothetical protein
MPHACLAPVGAGARGSCASRPVIPRLVHRVAPPHSFLSSLSVLRRPQTPADLQGFDLNAGVPGLGHGVVAVPGIDGMGPQLATASVIDADYIRRLGSVGGEPDYLVPARVQIVGPMSRRCLRRLSVKARRRQLKLERADRARGVVLLGSGTIVTYGELIDKGYVVTFGAPELGVPEFVYGIVPDGPSSVTLLPESAPGVTPPEIEPPGITAQVTENFFSIEVPPPLHYHMATVIWRDASGRTLKSLPGRAFL